MGVITPTSLAAGVSIEPRNAVINPATAIKQRKALITGYCSALAISSGIVQNTPIRVFSADDVGNRCGFGTEIHRLAMAFFSGAGSSVETWIVAQAEGGSDVVATATVTITGTATKAGTLYLYVNGTVVPVSVASGDTPTIIHSSIATAINAIPYLPVSAVGAAGQATLSNKTKGVFGNNNAVAVNLNGETIDFGVTVACSAFASGVGSLAMSTILNNLGTGDTSNGKGFTAIIHGTGKTTAVLDALSIYNGEGLTNNGCYNSMVGRPFRSLIGSAINDLATEIAFTSARKTDRTNGMIVVPNTPNNPQEVAALAMGLMESRNQTRAESGYLDIILPGVFPGASRWTDQYDNRNSAVANGISTTISIDTTVKLQNVVSFYRPNSIPQANNGYRSMRNISITQNVLNDLNLYFSYPDWKDITIVKDVKKVSNAAAKARAKDDSSLRDALSNRAGQYEGLAWIYSAEPTIKALAQDGAITIRQGGTGFDWSMPLMYSGEGGILNGVVLFDINISTK